MPPKKVARMKGLKSKQRPKSDKAEKGLTKNIKYFTIADLEKNGGLLPKEKDPD